MKYIVAIAVLIVFFACLAMTLHKLNYKPISYEIISWGITVSLFLLFEFLIHNR